MIAADRCVGQGEEDALADQDLAGEGETDAGATAFGGEEGHENLLANGGGDRLAVIADIECLLPAEVERAGSRLDGVLNEVDQGLPQQVLVGAERDRGWDGDVPDEIGIERLKLAGERAEIDRCRLRLL